MLADVRIGQAARIGSLTAFPLFCEESRPVEYPLSDKALETGAATVSEVFQQGSVPELVVENTDQGKVWEEVRKQQGALGVASPTAALADSYDKHQESLDAARKSLKYVEGSFGLAVAIGSKVASLDLYDKPATCQKVWDRLLSGIVLDALSDGGQTEALADAAQVTNLLTAAPNASWTQTEAVGEGQEYRAEFDGKAGSALLLDGSLVHGSVLAAV